MHRRLGGSGEHQRNVEHTGPENWGDDRILATIRKMALCCEYDVNDLDQDGVYMYVTGLGQDDVCALSFSVAHNCFWSCRYSAINVDGRTSATEGYYERKLAH